MPTAKKTSSKKAISKKTSTKKASSKKVSSKKKSSKKTSSKAKKEGVFAVIETGGKQYTVYVGDVVRIEKMAEEKQAGDAVLFENVLLVDDGKSTNVGTPYVSGAKVEGKVQDIGRHKKVDVSRFKSKSRYHVRYGHRQPYLEVEITKIG